MATTFLAPDPLQSTFFLPGTNTPGNGVKVFLYAAGTSTKQTAYKDNAGGAPWTNPIVLDSGGRLPSGGQIWFSSGFVYKAVYAPSNDTDPPVSPYMTLDNLSGINDVSSGGVSEWGTGLTPVFLSASSFLVTGDYTPAGQADVGRRVKAAISGNNIYGFVTSRVFSAGSTTINIVPENGSLDASLSSVQLSILTATNPSLPVGVTHGLRVSLPVVSSGLKIFASASENIALTSSGITTFSFDTAIAGQVRQCLVSGGPFTLSHNVTSIICPTGSSLACVSGDVFTVVAEAPTVYRVVGYQRVAGYDTKITLPTITTFTVATSGTYTSPANATWLELHMVGGGGGGAYAFGSSGAASVAATAGSSSTFGPYTAQGGAPGQTSATIVLAAAATGGDINISGATAGFPGTSTGSFRQGGDGANSFYGGAQHGGPPGANPSSAAIAGSGSGGGGGGASDLTSFAGGGGSAGAYLYKLIPLVSATSFPFTVGAGGIGGVPTGLGTGGGPGSSGRVTIIEHYGI